MLGMTTPPHRRASARLGLDQVLAGAHTVAQGFDRLPISPHAVADALLRRHRSAQRRQAPTDAGHDAPASWEELRASLLDPSNTEPAWVDMAYRVRQWRVSRLTWRTRMMVQLARRGWCEDDAWNLDHVLCVRLAGQLESLADQLHGWPDTEEFPTPEAWESALRAAAADLRRVFGSADTDAASDAWLACMGDEEQEKAAFDRYRALEAADSEAVTRALRWVADHHEHLWD